jgi:protein ImuB
MSLTQARAICDALVVRPVSLEAIAAAVSAIADVAGTLSSRVEIGDRDLVFMDCAGGGLLGASESELVTVLGFRAARRGLPVWIGIADSKLGASVAAREGGGVRIVPPGRTREFLAPLPLAFLDPDPEIAATLLSWGVRFIGDLCALPSGAVVHRLGPGGAMLVRRARGEDEAPLVGRATPQTFKETIVLDYVVDRLEPLIFILRRLIECVADRIGLHGLGCSEIEVEFDLEGGGRDLRTIAAAAPTTDHKVFVTLVRSHLERSPPAHSVTKISVVGVVAQINPTQLDFLRPSGPAPTALASTLARLAVICGPERVGVLRRLDSHRPEAVEVGRFQGQSAAGPEKNAKPQAAIYMALRAFRPPVPLEVFEKAGRLDYVRGCGFGGRVVRRAGPWRLRGEWWATDPYVREYYDVELSDGGVYRIYRDVRLQRWLADGVYD